MFFLCFSLARHFTRFHERFGFESHARVNMWNIRIYGSEDILPCAHFIFLLVVTWFDISRESNKLSGDMNYVRFGNRNAERNNLYRNKYSIQLNTKATHTQRSRVNVGCSRWCVSRLIQTHNHSQRQFTHSHLASRLLLVIHARTTNKSSHTSFLLLV